VPEAAPPKSSRIPFFVILLLSLLLWGGEYARRGLWEPDEARYAYVAREMRESGNWLVPSRHGLPYPDKPPLMFWLINASSLLTGGHINGVSARLPSLLGALMSLWAATRLMAAWQGRSAAWRTLWIMLTSFLFWHEGGMGQMDSLLCGLEMMALFFLFRNDDEPSVPRALAAYGFMGLAVLTKGPIGLVVPLGAYIAGRLAAGEGRQLARWHWLWGPFVSLALTAAWLFLAWRHGARPEYFHELLGQLARRATEGTAGHRHPFYYFLRQFPVEFLPWTLILPVAVAAPVPALRRRMLGWFAFVFVCFSLLADKRGLYILLGYPAAAMFIASAWDELPRLCANWTRSAAAAVVSLLGVVGLALALAVIGLFALGIPALGHLRSKVPVTINPLLLLPAAYFALGGAFLVARRFRESGLSSIFFHTFALSVFLLQICVGVLVYPALNPIKTPVELARVAEHKIPPGHPLLLYAMKGEILAFYANRPGREVGSVAELNAAAREQSRGVAAFTDQDWEKVRRRFDATYTAHPFRLGNKHLVWVEFER